LGMGISFFALCPNRGKSSGRFKMVYTGFRNGFHRVVGDTPF
jgi:hypothetical protein